jgi:hypothetical protein
VSGRGEEPNREEPRPYYVGRAKPPPPPMQPSDPYWPPLEDDVVVTYTAAGQPVARRKRSGFTVTMVVLGVFAVCCISGAALAMFGGALFRAAGGAASAPPGGGEPPPPTPEKPREPGLNTPVRDGRFEFVVKKVSCGHAAVGRNVVTMKASGQYCIVDITVKNIGKEGQAFADAFQKALGPDGTVYRPNTGAGFIANEGGGTMWNVINPGNSVTGKIVFDIPKDAEITKLEFHDGPLSGGVTVTLPARR